MHAAFRNTKWSAQTVLSRLVTVHNSKMFSAVFGVHHLSTTSTIQNASRLFTKTHEWVNVVNNTATVGISDHAQENLRDLVYIELPTVGSELQAGSSCGTLESVKAANDMYSPVSGKVTENNSNVEEEPSLVNRSCYEDGWLFKIELKKPEELQDLMAEDAYLQYLKTLS